MDQLFGDLWGPRINTIEEQPWIPSTHLIRVMRRDDPTYQQIMTITLTKTKTQQYQLESTPKDQPWRFLTFESCENLTFAAKSPNNYPTLSPILAISSIAILVH